MRKLVLIVALAIATPADAQAQKDAASMVEELALVDRQWQEAVVRGDAEFIETGRWSYEIRMCPRA